MKAKTLFLGAISCLFATGSYAQLQKGRKLAGAAIGGATYNNSSMENNFYYSGGSIATNYKDRAVKIILNPFYGWFISDKTVVGASINLDFSSRRFEIESGDPTKTTSSNVILIVEPFVRFFFSEKDAGCAPYIHLSAGMDYYPAFKSKTTTRHTELDAENSYTYTSQTNYHTTTGWHAGGGVGFLKMLNKNMALDAQINYYHSHGNFKYDNSSKRVYDATTPTQNGSSSSATLTKANPIGLKLGIILLLDRKTQKQKDNN